MGDRGVTRVGMARCCCVVAGVAVRGGLICGFVARRVDLRCWCAVVGTGFVVVGANAGYPVLRCGGCPVLVVERGAGLVATDFGVVVGEVGVQVGGVGDQVGQVHGVSGGQQGD